MKSLFFTFLVFYGELVEPPPDIPWLCLQWLCMWLEQLTKKKKKKITFVHLKNFCIFIWKLTL